MIMDYSAMGKNIARLRIQNKLTQEQLAEKIDVSTVFISQIETAVRKPSLETVYKLSVVFGTTIDTIIGRESIENSYNEIINLLKEKNPDEINFITGIIREITSGINNGAIIKK